MAPPNNHFDFPVRSLQVVDADTERTFNIPATQCIALELKLNVSSKGKKWSFIGDHLYNFAKGIHITPDTMSISVEQYDFLLLLSSKSRWQDCYGI